MKNETVGIDYSETSMLEAGDESQGFFDDTLLDLFFLFTFRIEADWLIFE